MLKPREGRDSMVQCQRCRYILPIEYTPPDIREDWALLIEVSDVNELAYCPELNSVEHLMNEKECVYYKVG